MTNDSGRQFLLRMRIARAHLVVCTFCLPLLLFAQHAASQLLPLVPCTATAPSVLLFSPSTPTTSQTVTVTVGIYRLIPDSISASVVDNVVSVTVGGRDVGFATAPGIMCRNVSVGPLPAGQYVLNLLWFYQGVTPSPPTLASTTTFEVVPGTAAAIPTWSSAAMLGTSLLVLLSAAFWFRRRT